MAPRSKRKHVSLSTEDQARLLRLMEEIDGRATELARIVIRNLRLSPTWPIAQYTMQSQQQKSGDLSLFEVTFTDGSKACYDEEASVCCEGPCPC